MPSSIRVLLGVVAVFVAVIAANTIGPGLALADNTELDWCARQNEGGFLEFIRVTTKDTGGETGRAAQDIFCHDTHGGFLVDQHFKDTYEEDVDDPFEGTLPETTDPEEFPDGWFGSLGPCLNLATTDATGDNRIQTVLITSIFELVAQIVYDVASNEPTGVAGAVTGALLGVARVPHFVLSWIYDVQDECQEIVERNTIQEIKAALGDHQTGLEAHNTALGEHNTALGEHNTALGEHNTALGEHNTALGTHDDSLAEGIERLARQVDENNTLGLRLFIEDHLETCSPLASMLLVDEMGLLPWVRDVVADLVSRAEAAGLSIGRAREELQNADYYIGINDPRRGFQKLCNAYAQVSGRPDNRGG